MKLYFIHNFNHEDMPESICNYPDYETFGRVCQSLDDRGIEYTTWIQSRYF